MDKKVLLIGGIVAVMGIVGGVWVVNKGNQGNKEDKGRQVLPTGEEWK